MAKINMVRVILGGLLTGLVVNIGEFLLNEPILGKEWETMMEALNLPPMGGSAMVWFVVTTFVLGIGIMWLYAAIRPRFGAGPKTAIFAGLAAWFFAWLIGFGSTIIMGLFPTKLVMITLVWGFFELPIASLAGAWLYKEK
ncbi:MAG: hypothetical protein ACE5WD_13155 [Candidatus Aminicenantia bacterium]